MTKSRRIDTTPRMVSIYELFAKLLPLMEGYDWAKGALVDLWNMGAPDPTPEAKPCTPGLCLLERRRMRACIPALGCAMVKRVLLPQQFAAWWQDVVQRQGLDLTDREALIGVHRKFGKIYGRQNGSSRN